MNTPPNEIVFPLSPRRRIFLQLFALLLFAAPLTLTASGIFSGDRDMTTAGFVVLAILSPLCGFLLFMAKIPRLTLNAEGISTRGTIGFSTYSVPWSSVERLRAIPGSEAVIMKEPIEGKAARTLRSFAGVRMNGVELYDQEQQSLISECRYLPIEAFGWWFDEGSLLAAVKRFAPALAAPFEADRAASIEVVRRSRRVLWWIFGGSAAIVAASIYFALNEEKIPVATQEKLSHGSEVVFAWLSLIAALTFIVYGFVNLRAAYRHARRREPWLSLLWLFAGVSQLLLALLLFGIWTTRTFAG